MAIIRVNMDKRSKGGVPLPDGDYTCEVISAAQGESSQKKSPQLNVSLEVVTPDQYAGSKMSDFLPLSEAAAFRAADFIHACGVDEPGESDVDTSQFCRLDDEGTEVQERGVIIGVRRVTTEETDQRDGQKRKRVRLFYSRIQAEEAPAEEAAEEAPAPVAPKPAIKKAAPAVAPAKPAKKLSVKA